MDAQAQFKKGFLELILLTTLVEQDRYGYEMTKLISERSNNKIKVPEGSLYPLLYKLMDKGYISDYEVPVGKKRMKRVYYHLEENGREYYRLLVDEYKVFIDNLNHLLFYVQDEGEDIANEGHGKSET